MRPYRQDASLPKGVHVISVSLYTEDLERLDAKVGQLKARGFRKANRSVLIRLALDQVNLLQIEKGIG